MRRAIGLILTGLGAFLLALAALSRFYVAGELVKFPLNEYHVTTLVGHDVNYFSQKQVNEVTGVTVQATQTIEGDVAASSSSTAVWQSFTTIEDITDNQQVSYTAQRSAFNRRTGSIVDCCGEFVGNNTAVRQSGQGYLWPLGTQKRTYQVFDPQTMRPEPYRYAGTATVDGMTTYKFVEQAGNVRTGSQTLPGWLAGSPNRAVVTLPEYITKTSAVWVDPVTGIPIDETQTQDQTLQSGGVTELVLFQGTLTETSQSIADAVGIAGSYHLKIDLLEGAGPLGAALLGVVLAGLGVFLTRPRVAVAGREPDRAHGIENGQLASVGPGPAAESGPWQPPGRPDRAGHWNEAESWNRIETRQAASRWDGTDSRQAAAPWEREQTRQAASPWDRTESTQESEPWDAFRPRQRARPGRPGPASWPAARPEDRTEIRQQPAPWDGPEVLGEWDDGGRRILEPGQAEPRLDRDSRSGWY